MKTIKMMMMKLTQKEKKIDSSDNEMAVDCIQANENKSGSIRTVVKLMLESNYDAPQAIIQLILEYNTCSVWYRNNCSDRERFFDYANKEIDAEIVSVFFFGEDDMKFLQTINGEIYCRGDNSNYTLGLGHDEFINKFISNKYFIKKQIKIKNIWSDGKYRTIFQNEKNEIYACGYQKI